MIKKLPQEVINKIAAGEVVQRPYSVVKEMVENSIDANSTQITIFLINAGLDLIKIVDNGTGILKEDYEFLCERYATSKIRTAEDLQQLNSFGFRGEALASISFVSDVIVLSKRREENLGFKGNFKNQKLLSLEAVGCSDGTEFQISSLFYNLEKRRQALNKSEEKKSILQLIQNLSIHHNTIDFRLFIENKCEFSSSTPHDIISQIMKINQSSLLEKQISSNHFNYNCNIIFTKLSAIKYKREFCLFINDRLVECDCLKKKITQIYQECYLCLRVEDGGYYVYLNLKLQPKDIDPNVHPNKKIIRFLNEDEISSEITEQLKQDLQPQQTIKLVQTTLIQPIKEDDSKKNSFRQSLSNIYQKEKVRTDPKSQTLIQQFSRKSAPLLSQKNQNIENNNQLKSAIFEEKLIKTNNQDENQEEAKFQQQIDQQIINTNYNKETQIVQQDILNTQQVKIKIQFNQIKNTIIEEEHDNIDNNVQNIKSIQFEFQQYTKQKLFDKLQKNHCSDTWYLYKNISFVGYQMDQQQIIIQHETKLCVINSVIMLFNMFITQIANNEIPTGVIEMLNDGNQINIKCEQQKDFQLQYDKNENDYEIKIAIQIAETLSLQEYQLQFIRDQLVPYFKLKQIAVLNNQVQEITKLEELYKYFERC